MKKMNFMARLLFLLGIVSLSIGGIVVLIFTYQWAEYGVPIDFFQSYLYSLVIIALSFLIISFILFGLSELIEQQSLTNQLLAKQSNINLASYHTELINQQLTNQTKEPSEGYHFTDSSAPQLHHAISVKRSQNVDWYTADSDLHWISQTIDQLGEKVHTITALPWSNWYAATTASDTHLVKIDRDRTNEATRAEWGNYPEISDWWKLYQAKQSTNS